MAFWFILAFCARGSSGRKAWELRTATSEGFGSKDLMDAKALLDALRDRLAVGREASSVA
jgi:hypothetical protein